MSSSHAASAEVLTNCVAATTSIDGRTFEIIRDAAIVTAAGKIIWVGPKDHLAAEYRRGEACDLSGAMVTPGLIECHTHLVFAGDRDAERAERAAGDATYAAQIARGDGIHVTARATAMAGEQTLFEQSLARAKAFVRRGVTTLEIKSGYGFEVDKEIEMLRVARQIGTTLQISVATTLLAGHVYPVVCDREEFVEAVCHELLPAAFASGYADAVEVCCDECVGLDLDDTSTILETAYRKKVPTRLQTDFLTDSAGAALAPGFYARAAAHLLFTDDLGVQALKAGGTTAVLLPQAAEALQIDARPPVEAMREQGVAMAVSTGFNPGTAPCAEPLRAAALARSMFGLTAIEAFAGVTRHAARALGLRDGRGDLRAGAPADLAVWNVTHPEELVDGAKAVCRYVLVGRRGPIIAQLNLPAPFTADLDWAAV